MRLTLATTLVMQAIGAGHCHGFEIVDVTGYPTGTVYPALRRLERAGHVVSDWSTVGGRKRRTYKLTSAGLRALNAERSAWQEFTTVIGGVLGGDGKWQQA